MAIKTFCVSASLCVVVASTALAGSRGVVTSIRSNDPDIGMDCVSFLTQNDGTRRGFSLRDSGAQQALFTLNSSRMLTPGPAYVEGEPVTGGHASDCAAGVVYIHSIER